MRFEPEWDAADADAATATTATTHGSKNMDFPLTPSSPVGPTPSSSIPQGSVPLPMLYDDARWWTGEDTLSRRMW